MVETIPCLYVLRPEIWLFPGPGKWLELDTTRYICVYIYVYVGTYVGCSYAVKPRNSGARTEMTRAAFALAKRVQQWGEIWSARLFESDDLKRDVKPKPWDAVRRVCGHPHITAKFRSIAPSGSRRAGSGQVSSRTRWFRVNEPNFSIRRFLPRKRERRWENGPISTDLGKVFSRFRAKSIKICLRNFAAFTTDSARWTMPDTPRESQSHTFLSVFKFFFGKSRCVCTCVCARKICQLYYD